jgi:hypothetical protein
VRLADEYAARAGVQELKDASGNADKTIWRSRDNEGAA